MKYLKQGEVCEHGHKVYCQECAVAEWEARNTVAACIPSPLPEPEVIPILCAIPWCGRTAPDRNVEGWVHVQLLRAEPRSFCPQHSAAAKGEGSGVPPARVIPTDRELFDAVCFDSALRGLNSWDAIDAGIAAIRAKVLAETRGANAHAVYWRCILCGKLHPHTQKVCVK